MRQLIIITILFFSILSCNKTEKENLETKETIDLQQIDSSTVNLNPNITKSESADTYWYDKIISDYIKKSDNELIKLSLKNNTKIEWFLDRTESNDSTKYLIFNIGHDAYDEGKTNKRFSSCGWIYIDSLKRKIYEYDLPNDSLIEWKKYYR